MRQYAAVKKDHPTALLFFRLGDFYELFFDDAIVASRELQITLTSRNKEKGIAVPMCGVPHHAAEGYIGKLIRKGYKVAICEQMEDPRLTKKIVRREVTRVVTPGTAADSSLGSEENNFLAAIAQVGDRVGFAALDVSTGEFRATEFSGENALRRVQEELEQLRPKEVLYGSAAPLFDRPDRPASLGGAGESIASTKEPGVSAEADATAALPSSSGSRLSVIHFRGRAPPEPCALRLRWMIGFFLPTMPSHCWRITLGFCRSKGLGWRGGQRPRLRRGPFFIMCAPRNGDRSTM